MSKSVQASGRQQNFPCKKKLKVEIGAGKAKDEGDHSRQPQRRLRCGREVSIRGRVNGDLKVNCGVGSCKFELDNKESDFKYKLSCALGSIRLNGNKISCLGTQKRNTVKRGSIGKSSAGMRTGS